MENTVFEFIKNHSSASTVASLLFITVLLLISYRHLKKKINTNELNTIHSIMSIFSITLLITFTLSLVIFLLDLDKLPLDKYAGGISAMIGLPAALSASFVALLLALRSFQLSEKQNFLLKKQVEIEEKQYIFEKKIDSRIQEQNIRNELSLIKNEVDQCFIELHSSITSYVSISSIIYEELYNHGESKAYTIYEDTFYKAYERLIMALNEVSKNPSANNIWEALSKTQNIDCECLHQLFEHDVDYTKFKFYLPDSDFSSNSISNFLFRTSLNDKNSNTSNLYTRVSDAKWGVIAEFIATKATFIGFAADYDIDHYPTVVWGPDIEIITNKVSSLTFHRLYSDEGVLNLTKTLKNDEAYKLVLEIFTTVHPSLNIYRELITPLLKQTGLNISFDDWYHYLEVNAFNNISQFANNKSQFAKLSFAGYLLSRGTNEQLFPLPVNLGYTIIKNLLLLLDGYTTDSKSIISVFHVKFSYGDIDLVNKIVDEFITHSPFKIDKEIMDSLTYEGDFPLSAMLGSGQNLESDFFKILFSQSEFRYDFCDEEEFWESIMEAAIKKIQERKQMICKIYDYNKDKL